MHSVSGPFFQPWENEPFTLSQYNEYMFDKYNKMKFAKLQEEIKQLIIKTFTLASGLVAPKVAELQPLNYKEGA